MKNNSSTGQRFYASGALFIVKDMSKTVPFAFSGGRNDITHFSKSSGARMRKYLRETLCDYSGMLTLTYPFYYPHDGKAVKEHLRKFLQEVRREHRRTFGEASAIGFSAFWFLEFQERGAPHFHIFTTWNPSKEWVSKKWFDICNTEDERHLRAGTRTEVLRGGRGATMAYASKYAAKSAQKTVPAGFENVGRFWGVSGRRDCLSADTYVTQEQQEDPRVAKSIKRIKMHINSLMFTGDAEKIKCKQPGTHIFIIHDHVNQQLMRRLVSQLACKTMNFSSMFIDAEIDP